jgi:hypothetical protein
MSSDYAQLHELRQEVEEKNAMLLSTVRILKGSLENASSEDIADDGEERVGLDLNIPTPTAPGVRLQCSKLNGGKFQVRVKAPWRMTKIIQK